MNKLYWFISEVIIISIFTIKFNIKKIMTFNQTSSLCPCPNSDSARENCETDNSKKECIDEETTCDPEKQVVPDSCEEKTHSGEEQSQLKNVKNKGDISTVTPHTKKVCQILGTYEEEFSTSTTGSLPIARDSRLCRVSWRLHSICSCAFLLKGWALSKHGIWCSEILGECDWFKSRIS